MMGLKEKLKELIEKSKEIYEYSKEWEEECKKAVEESYNKGFSDGDKNGYNDASEEKQGYTKGLEDAWECAKKIAEGKFDGFNNLNYIAKTYSILDVIEKIEVLEKKMQIESVHVGDEIYSDMTDSKAVIVHIDSWGNWHCLTPNGIMKLDENHKKYWKPTNVSYPDVLATMEILKNGTLD